MGLVKMKKKLIKAKQDFRDYLEEKGEDDYIEKNDGLLLAIYHQNIDIIELLNKPLEEK